MGIKEKLKELGLSEELANSSFAATINLVDIEEARKIKDYLSYYEVNITKASQLKIFTYNEDELKVVLAKLQYLKDNNIPVVDEYGDLKEYLLDISIKHSMFSDIFPDVDLSAIVPDVLREKSAISEELLTVLQNGVDMGLTEEDYDWYIELEQLLTRVNEGLYGFSTLNSEVTSSLVKIVSSKVVSDPKDIIFAALIYKQNKSQEEIEKIKETIQAVMETREGGAPGR